MGCGWKTVGGRRIRMGPVASPTIQFDQGVQQILSIMQALGLKSITASPTVTETDLANATVRIWRDSEKGYFIESKLDAGAVPVYHQVSQQEAQLWLVGRPTPAMIGQAFHRDNTTAEVN